MSEYLTVDSGTTNTRISIVSSGQVTDSIKFPIGARLGITDTSPLKNALRDGIADILKKNSKNASDIKRVILSGMITSSFGLVDLAHIEAPAGLSELHSTMYETEFPQISEIPFSFIRGVKTAGKSLEDTDMMRGEETELQGIVQGEGIYILPGSHSKIINADKDGRIVSFKTMLTGEMISALSSSTILKGSVDLSSHQDIGFLKKGFEYSREKGLNEALFKVRVLNTLFGATADQTYSFFIGAILAPEINSIISSAPAKIIIGGKKAIREAMAVLFDEFCTIPAIMTDDRACENASALGAVKIFEYGIDK